MPELSIVIVSYNCYDYLAICLDSISRYIERFIDCEIIIVDNNSSDFDKIASSFNRDNVKIIKLDYNAGFPKANNIAFKEASGSFILMLNPDTKLMDSGIIEMVRLLKASSNMGIIAPKLLNPDMSIQESVQAIPNLANSVLRILGFTRYKKNFHMPKVPFLVDTVSGAFMLFPASFVREVGGLNEDLFWIEDIDFCNRAKLVGKSVMYFPYSCVVHYGGQSAKRNVNLSLYLQLTNRIRYFSYYGKKNTARLLYLVTMLAIVLRFFLYCGYVLVDGKYERLVTLRAITKKIVDDRIIYF